MTVLLDPCLAVLEEISRMATDVSDVMSAPRKAEARVEVLPEALKLQARRTAYTLRRLCQKLSASNSLEDLAGILSGESGGGASAAELLRQLSDLVDLFVHEAERLYGSGTGAKKQEFVRLALLRFFRELDIDIPHVPGIMEPYVYDTVATILVESVFQLSKRSGTLVEVATGTVMARPPGFLARRTSGLQQVLRNLGWWLVRLCNRVDPAVQREVDRVAMPGGVEALRKSITMSVEVMSWMLGNIGSLKAFADVVLSAVEQARGLAGLTSLQKRAYARVLVMAFLEDIGVLAGRSEMFRSGVAVFIDGAIDASVSMLVRHQRWTESEAWYRPA